MASSYDEYNVSTCVTQSTSTQCFVLLTAEFSVKDDCLFVTNISPVQAPNGDSDDIKNAHLAKLIINGEEVPPLGRAKVSPGDIIDFGLGPEEIFQVYRNVHAHA